MNTNEAVEAVARAITPMLFGSLEDIYGKDLPPKQFDDLPVDWQGRVLEIAQAALAAARPFIMEEAWQPIETAPRDGEPVLIWKPDERMVGEYMMAAYWDEDASGFIPVGGFVKQGYRSEVTGTDQGYPTHWQPLPAPPRTAAKTDGGNRAQ